MNRSTSIAKSSTAAKSAAQRKSLRAQVLPTEIRGISTLITTGEHLPFLVWDVASEGVGLWLPRPLAPHEKIKVALGQPWLILLEGTVVWCNATKETEGFRCGVNITKGAEALAQLYESFGG